MRLCVLRLKSACLTVTMGLVLAGCGGEAGSKSAATPQPSVATSRPASTTAVQSRVATPAAVGSPPFHLARASENRDDWSRFRGPDGSGVSNATGLPLTWSGTQNITWKTALPGPGSSSPIVFRDHVYVSYYSGYGLSIESAGDPANLKRHLVCIDRNAGKVLWTATMAADAEVAPFNDPIAIGKHGYASSTPAADASGVYVFYGSTGAAAYTHEGDLKWHVSCGKQTHVYGTASSPILLDDLLIVHAEIESNSLIALDKATGRERWRQPKTEGEGNTWSTPNVFDVDGRPELVFVSGYGKVAAADPASGAKLWEFDAQIRRINPTITRGDGLYFMLGGPNGNSVALEVDRSGSAPRVEIKWELNKSSYITSPVYHNGHLYWAHEGGSIAYCVNARTGELVYQNRFEPVSGEIFASPVVADGRIYYVSRENGTFVLPARPEFEVLAHNVIESDGSPFNGSPAISGGQIFLRSDKFVYCIGQNSQAARTETTRRTESTSYEPASRNPTADGMQPLVSPTRAIAPIATGALDRADEAAAGAFAQDDAGYGQLIHPFLSRHCLKCHGPAVQEADFRVDQLPNDFLTRSVAERWSEVLDMLNAGEMPPEEEPRPPSEDVARVAEWITRERLRGEEARKVTSIVLRRMNRVEYNNTIRDLIGVEMRPGDEFPADPPAGGFDNIGAALTISPLHLEMYLKAAQDVLDRAIITDGHRPPTIKWRFQLEEGNQGLDRYRATVGGQRIIVNGGNSLFRNGMTVLRREQQWDGFAEFRDFRVPHPGYYAVRMRAAGVVPPEEAARRAGPQFHQRRQQDLERKLTSDEQRRPSRESFEKWVRPYVEKHFAEDRRYRYGPPRVKLTGYLGGARRILGEFDVDAPETEPGIYEVRAWFEPVAAGVQARNVYRIAQHNYNFWFQEHDDFPRPELLIDWMEIEGPLYDEWPPASHRRIFIDCPNKGRDEEAYARDVLAHFMRRAYRRPLRDGEIDSKLAMFRRVRPDRASLEEALKTPLIAVLCSPHFLYLVEPASPADKLTRLQPSNTAAHGAGSNDGENPGVRRLDDHELATRLSYFLWSSMPDDELFALAEHGRLASPHSLFAQADRMLADERSEQFVKNFGGQWLGLRDVGANPPAENIFPRYDDHLEVSMRGESEAFFAHLLHNNLSALNFLRSDFVTINERLARFYDIPGVKGDRFRVVQVPPGVPRGGLVTQASILTVTSNGTRTSPVRRGVWILERLLGDPPRPPPPNAGDIPPGVPGLDKVTVRERLRLHREQTQCARCHSKIDPLGFALENFNASGEWRDREAQNNSSQWGPNDPPIDAHAQLPDGAEFVGVEGLQNELLKREDAFLRCLAEKVYVYALGRELGLADEPAVESAVRHMKQNQFTIRSLIHQVVSSDLFGAK